MTWYRESTPTFDVWRNYNNNKVAYAGQKQGIVEIFKGFIDRKTMTPRYVVQSRIYVPKITPHPHFKKIMDKTRRASTYKNALKSANQFRTMINKVKVKA